jgi:DNA-binding transcriptional ArsR family regulator
MAGGKATKTKATKGQTSDDGSSADDNGQTSVGSAAEPRPRATRGRATPADPKAASMAKIRQAAMLLKQVSDPTRLQVLMLLTEKERNVSELCADLGTQSQPAVSHHLALLRHGRLIEPRRSGKHNFYYLTEAGRELAQVVNTIVG